MNVIWIMLGMALVFGLAFVVFWVLNPTENGSTFRDWIRRFPW